MSYAQIDPIIDIWKKAHSLLVYTKYKDDEIRSCHVTNSFGRECQIWITSPVAKRVTVNVWDFADKKKEWSTDIQYLEIALEEALATAQKWLR